MRKHTRRVSGVVNPNAKKYNSMIQSLKVSLKPAVQPIEGLQVELVEDVPVRILDETLSSKVTPR